MTKIKDAAELRRDQSLPSQDKPGEKKTRRMTDLARVIRSKNAGPYELTLDMIFKNNEIYTKVKENKLINAEKIAEIYKIDKAVIKGIVYFDPAYAVKVTMKRELPSGAYGDSDIYGAQQHAPLFKLEFDI